MRARCGRMNDSLVLNTRSTGAEVAGVQKTFLNSIHANQQTPCSVWLVAKVLSSLATSSRFMDSYLYGRNRVARIVILVSYCVQNAESSKIFKDLGSEDEDDDKDL